MKDEAQKSIVISVNIKGTNQDVEIKPAESSDGAPFYYCEVNGARITQIRKDDHNNWEQLWGDLDEATVKSIGRAIEENSNL